MKIYYFLIKLFLKKLYKYIMKLNNVVIFQEQYLNQN